MVLIFSLGIFFLAVIYKLLEITQFTLKRFFLQLLQQLFKYFAIWILCWSIFQKQNIFIHEKPFSCIWYVARSIVILKRSPSSKSARRLASNKVIQFSLFWFLTTFTNLILPSLLIPPHSFSCPPPKILWCILYCFFLPMFCFYMFLCIRM